MAISNEEIIEIIEKEKLLGGPVWKNIGRKKNLLMGIGFEWLFENNRYHIKVEAASSQTVADHLEAAYLCTLREEGLL